MLRTDLQNHVVRLSDLGNKRAVLVIPSKRRPFVEDVHRVISDERGASSNLFSFHAFLSFVLIPLLTLQPFVRVYAQEVPESIPVEENVSSDVVSAETDETNNANQEGEEGIETVQKEQEETDPILTNQTDEVEEEIGNDETSTDEPTQEEVSPDVLSDAPASEEDSATSTEATEEDSNPSEAGTTTDEVIQNEETIIGDSEDPVASTTSEVVEDESNELAPQEENPEEVPEITFPVSTDQEASTQISLDQVLREKEEVMRTELRRQIEAEFTRGCVELDSAGYYCLKQQSPKWNGSMLPSASISSVTSEVLPGDTDKEIFAERAGERIQLTSNDVDDVFPAKDISGSTVVWQGMVEGRWQVFLATFASSSPRVSQLTSGIGGSFHPRVDGTSVVWQAWVDNNWEIFHAFPHVGEARKDTDPLPQQNIVVGVGKEWDVSRITLTEAHDMFPAIAGDVITWQRSENGGWVVYAYSIKSGVEVAVSSLQEKSENPRFALVYEERSERGVRLMGYDVATGENVDLSEKVKLLPNDSAPYVPQSPVTGEDQAALPTTGTSTSRSEFEENDNPLPV